MSLLVEQKLRSRRMQTWVEIWEQQVSLSLRWRAAVWQHPARSSRLWSSPSSCADSRSKDITNTTPGTVSQCLCAQSCPVLAKSPVVFFLHRNSHLPRTLCVLYTCTSTFCFLQQKKDEHLFVNCIKNFFFFCAKRLTARPSNQEKSTGILSNLLFPTARNSKEKGHLCPSLSRVLSPWWIKKTKVSLDPSLLASATFKCHF